MRSAAPLWKGREVYTLRTASCAFSKCVLAWAFLRADLASALSCEMSSDRSWLELPCR